jgi:hypothetical protein
MRAARYGIALATVLCTCTVLPAAEPKDGYFTTSDGLKIHYLEAGKPDAAGAPVVLIHGFSGNANGNWFLNGIADALAATSRTTGANTAREWQRT